MDPNRFDRLTQALAAAPSRRGIARSLAGLTLAAALAPLLGLAGPNPADARNKKKKRKKRKKTPSCTPSCEAPMSCRRGKCDCPDPTVLCNGACHVNTCNAGLAFNPLTCDCCRANGSGGCFSGPPSCCSEACVEATNVCSGRNVGAPCDFNAQCASEFCSPAGVCVLFLPTA